MRTIILSLLTICLNFSSIIGQIDNKHLSYDDFKSTLRKDMDYKTILETFGQPTKDIGSGIYIYVYELTDSTTMIIGCTDKILYAKHCDEKNNLLHDLIESSDSIITNEKFESTYLAMLRPNIKEKNATINDQIMFTAKSGQLILYNDYAHNAWIADGRSGYIPPEDLEKIDTTYFKFNFSKYDFVFKSTDELFEATQRLGININTLTDSVVNKDKNALLRLFRLRNSFDGAAAGMYPGHFWALINLWSDKELMEFVKSINAISKKQFVDYISDNYVTFPLEKPLTYYKLYYPETLKLILANK